MSTVQSRTEILTQLQEHPDVVLLMQEVQAMLNRESEKRKEYRELVHESVRAEFINGEIVYYNSPAKRRHWRVSTNLICKLGDYVKKNDLGEVGGEKVMVALTRNDYEPDISFFSKDKAIKFKDEQMLFPAPDFVVEILSPSTEKYDRNEKFIDYAAHGVSEYWIIDAEQETVEQYFNEGGKFNLFQKLHKGQLESKSVKGFAIDLKDIFN
jgi:Uma2 family endonuclease